MTVLWLVLFAVVFALGPWVFLQLMRLAPSPVVLVGLIVMAAATSLWLRFLAPVPWGANVWVTWIGIALIWTAWIAMLALAMLAMRQVDPGRTMRRWTGVIGAMGTTVPWFGLAFARLLNS
ncbi:MULTISPECIES: hypothetical protein [Roseobacteraceae]|uniref:Uncharacterized protein n=1 Tax=Pseudosulfitobacter pseudonitzschiae TaxID=1402135 RepID=A0A221K5P7_9RHOB|nr:MULTISPECIES: hypothetical protein [Roseobacteraceae]ASM74183.1 hypothetical protein SULPSESMR1_03411 [Pseudosulfitobacter pseudonitzschiae]